MQSLYHNVTNFDGFMQSAGKEFKAKKVRRKIADKSMKISMRLEDAYPKECGLDFYERKVSFEKEKGVIVSDCSKGNFSEAYFTLMTAEKPEIESSGEKISIKVGEVGFIYILGGEKVFCEEIKIDDDRLSKSWGASIYRIRVLYKSQITAVFS